jgi:gas vesicle protein
MNVRSPWFVAGFLAGGGIGAALALLYAPMPGGDLIRAIRDHVRHATREASEAGQRAEADVLTRYRAIRSQSVSVPAEAARVTEAQPSLGGGG